MTMKTFNNLLIIYDSTYGTNLLNATPTKTQTQVQLEEGQRQAQHNLKLARIGNFFHRQRPNGALPIMRITT